MLHPGPAPTNAAAAGDAQPKGKAKTKAKAAKQDAAIVGGAVPSSPTAVVDRPDIAHQGNGGGGPE